MLEQLLTQQNIEYLHYIIYMILQTATWSELLIAISFALLSVILTIWLIQTVCSELAHWVLEIIHK